MSADIIQFSDFGETITVRRKDRIPRKTFFYLGSHTFSGMPGSSWSTGYWVDRCEDGKCWQVLCTTDDSDDTPVPIEYLDADGVKAYFDSVGFSVSDERWHAMGWRERHSKIHQAEIIALPTTG